MIRLALPKRRGYGCGGRRWHAATLLDSQASQESASLDLTSLYKEIEWVVLSALEGDGIAYCNFYALSDTGQVRQLVSDQRSKPMGSCIDNMSVASAVTFAIEQANERKDETERMPAPIPLPLLLSSPFSPFSLYSLLSLIAISTSVYFLSKAITHLARPRQLSQYV